MSSNTTDSEPNEYDPSSASSVQPEDNTTVAEAIDRRVTDSLSTGSNATTARSRRSSAT